MQRTIQLTQLWHTCSLQVPLRVLDCEGVRLQVCTYATIASVIDAVHACTHSTLMYVGAACVCAPPTPCAQCVLAVMGTLVLFASLPSPLSVSACRAQKFMGRVCHALGQVERAIVHYRRSLELKPDQRDGMIAGVHVARLTGQTKCVMVACENFGTVV